MRPSLDSAGDPVARHTDPETSHLAAESVKNLTAARQWILRTIQLLGPCTDERIAVHHRNTELAAGWVAMSPSGLRTRRSELVALGLVRNTGKRESMATGRLAILWEVVPGQGRLF